MVRMNTQYELNKAEKFFQANKETIGDMISEFRFRESLEMVKINIDWLQINLEKLHLYFNV